jgi:hypothetical protein
MTEVSEPDAADEVLESASDRVGRVRRAVKTWTGELVDFSGRNTLLYYRDLKQGTLDLGPASGASLMQVEALLSSRRVRLSEMFGDDVLAQAARRARTIKAKANENFEERGLRTMFLAWGMATWTSTKSASTPAAPVLLRQADLAGRGGTGEDFDAALPGEWELNPTLFHLLKSDYGLDLSRDEILRLLDQDAEPPDAAALFDRLVKECAQVPGFSVTRRVVIGNFSYAKLPMVLDLENATETLVASELICAIAGDEEARKVVRARHPQISENGPDVTPPSLEFLVLDADASQSYAINCARRGADLVIEGPPGTGKSQTIANLIAELSARGQRVLFVAEKRAAIDAVLDRLGKVGLEDLVLDLHDGAGAKRKLAADLARTLERTASIAKPDLSAEHENFTRYRHALVARNEALHAPREPWGISVYEIYSALPDIPQAATSSYRLGRETLAGLDGSAFRNIRSELESFASLGGLSLSEQVSVWAPFFAANTISTQEAARAALEAVRALASRSLPETAFRLGKLLAECGLREPETIEAWISALELLKGVSDSLASFESAVFEAPLDDLASALAPAAKGALSRTMALIGNGDYRQARKSARAFWRQGKPKSSALHAAVIAAAEQTTTWRQVTADGSLPHLPTDLDGTAGAFAQFYAELTALANLSGGTGLIKLSATDLQTRLREMLEDAQTLFKLPELSRCRNALYGAGLQQLVEEMTSRRLGTDHALSCADHVWMSSVLEAVSMSDPRVGAFDGQAHHRAVAEFRKADRAHITSSVTRVRRAVAENATRVRDEHPTESDVIEHQAHLRRGHLPIRQLFQAAPNVLGALRPCWAMSPLVVSQLLPAVRCFDVVIFDEASQVTPADAVGALMRADRAVVAGDPHQLPPTSFFATSGGGEDDEITEAQPVWLPGGTQNMESVLDVMAALLPAPKGTRTLNWHYRSKDERLIAFSNAQPALYDWALTTFPGASSVDCLSHVLVPYRPGRLGQEESISDEVARVTELVTEHAQTRPSESLGVIAMGIKHANRIDEALRLARAKDNNLDRFLTGNGQAKEERFFVKNLERVQGDERDAIILTIGYGKTADGRMLYRFGPINNEGGERRLNVAITRARARMTVVSSFASADMDPGRLRADGAKMLYGYLAYAESGGTNLGTAARVKPELNPFERDVDKHLRSAGVALIPQFGCSGYWIDFAAQHPARPGQMVLAFECDGATYHSSYTARDRDRLRQEHLERLGWTFHRIWSQDWFYHREREIRRAVDAYHAAVAAVDQGQVKPGQNVPDGRPTTNEEPAPASRQGPCPIWIHDLGIDYYADSELDALIRWIESDTLLRTEDQLLAEAIRELGFRRRGSKIVDALTSSVRRVRQGQAR